VQFVEIKKVVKFLVLKHPEYNFRELIGATEEINPFFDKALLILDYY